LRTAALSAELTAPDGTLAIVGLDFAARRLGSIDVLPSTVTVATGDDLEAVTRVIALLDHELHGVAVGSLPARQRISRATPPHGPTTHGNSRGSWC